MFVSFPSTNTICETSHNLQDASVSTLVLKALVRGASQAEGDALTSFKECGRSFHHDCKTCNDAFRLGHFQCFKCPTGYGMSRVLCKILEYPQWVSGFVVAVRSESGYISEMTRSLCASSTTNYLQRLEGPFLFFQFFCNHTYLVPDWNSFLF